MPPSADDSRSTHARFLLAMPFIYGMIAPLFLLDMAVTAYQRVSFPLLGIPRVLRSPYFIGGRRHLPRLRWYEKVNCEYCGYANGLLAFSREIFARTEQYWCPIKHSRPVKGAHDRYPRFVDYGDGREYHRKLLALRDEMMKEGKPGTPGGA